MRAEIGLLIGTLTGLGMVLATAIIGGPDDRLPPAAIATVNGEIISTEAFIRAVEMVNSERRTALDAADREQVLERLVDEELLFQYAMELGLAREHPRIRKLVVQELMSTVRDAADTDLPGVDELRRFYDEHPAYFRSEGRVRGAVIYVASESMRSREEARRRADEAAERLRQGDSLDEVVDTYHDGGFRLPSSAIPPDKLRDYLGASLSRTLLEMEPPSISDPIPGTQGFYILVLSERQPGDLKPFEAVREQAQETLLRRRSEQRLQDLVKRLRADADIRRAE